MGRYCGITTDPARRKKEHQDGKYPNLYNWRVVKEFDSKDEAQDWEDAQEGYTRNPGGDDSNDPNATWYGYKFDY